MDDTTPTLSNNLETPIAPPSNATPPVPPIPVIEPESPEPVKPKSKLMKNLPKIAAGLAVMALLIVGGITGSNLIQQRTQVEQQAAVPGACQTRSEDNCVSDGCMDDTYNCKWDPNLGECQKYGASDTCGGGDGDDGGGGPSVGGCNNASGCTAFPDVDPDDNKEEKCLIIRYHCDDKTRSACGGSENQTAASNSSLGFVANCGVEQIDMSCEVNRGGPINGQYFAFKRYDNNCVDRHSECRNNACVNVDGSGEDKCNNDSDCGGGGGPSPSSTANTCSCVDLTKKTEAPVLGDTVEFKCDEKSSANNPVAFFRHRVDGGDYTKSLAINLNDSKNAKYSITIDRAGDWQVQCRICTNANANNCTAWGEAK